MAKTETELKVTKGKTGNFTFTVYVAGIGATAEEAWQDCCESLAMDGMGVIPDIKDIELEYEE